MPAVFVAMVLLLAACSSSTGSTWTIAPLHATPSAPASAAASQPAGSPGQSQPAGSPGQSQPAGSPGQSQPAGSPGQSQPAGSPGQGAARTIELDLTNTLQITQNGSQVTELDVHAGETIHFVINNTAGFDHDFFIGTADQLSQGTTSGLPGVPPFQSGSQKFDYEVTADTDGLQFACTVPGHYQSMHGTFKVVP
jgi:uncharacterized cupredoxin-like copper-binding protein